MARSTQSATYYLHPDGWSEQPDGALGRIRSRVSTRTQVMRECILDEPDGKGGWRERAVPATSHVADGWQWFAWRGMRAGVPLVIFRGVRPLDPDMAGTLCDGLTLHEPSGEVLDSPAAAGMTFALAPGDAREFRARALAAGGIIATIPPDMDRAGRAAAGLSHDATQAATFAQQAMDMIHAGGAAGRTTIRQMDDVLAAAWACRARGQIALEEVEQWCGAAPGMGTDEAVASAALEITARSDWQRIEDAISQITGAQREAAEQIAATDAGPAAPPLAAPFDQWHGHIAARLRAQGQDARVEDGELVVDLPTGQLRLGQTARIDPVP